MSFFQPKEEGKAKKPEKETSNSTREIESPPKVALKERNRVVPEGDSPVRRPGRKVARVLGSEGEDEEDASTPPKRQKLAPDSPQVSHPGPVSFPESSPSLSSSSPEVISPSGIPKRRTARKQLSKRTFQDVLEEQSEDKDREAKRPKTEEEAETPTESLTEPEVSKKQEAEEGDQPTTPPEPPKTARVPGGSGGGGSKHLGARGGGEAGSAGGWPGEASPQNSQDAQQFLLPPEAGS